MSVIGDIGGALFGGGSGPITAPTNRFAASLAPQAGFSPGMAMGPVADQQAQYARMLQAQVAGQGPSLAQQQLQSGLNQVNAQSASAIGSQRGINPGLAARQILDAQAAAGQNAAGQAAQVRSGEQMNAQGMLGTALASQRSGDIGFGNLVNAQNRTAIENSLGTQGLNAATAAQNANLQMQAQTGNAGANQNFLGSLLSGAGGAAALFGASRGALVPGKARVAGDSPKNDTVPIEASPGEIVLPRSVTQAEDAPEKAAAFVRAIRRNTQSSEAPHYGHVVKALRESNARLRRIEQHLASGGTVGASATPPPSGGTAGPGVSGPPPGTGDTPPWWSPFFGGPPGFGSSGILGGGGMTPGGNGPGVGGTGGGGSVNFGPDLTPPTGFYGGPDPVGFWSGSQPSKPDYATMFGGSTPAVVTGPVSPVNLPSGGGSAGGQPQFDPVAMRRLLMMLQSPGAGAR